MRAQLIFTIIMMCLVFSNAARRFRNRTSKNSSISGQIIGGTNVGSIGNYPWMASIFRLPTTPIEFCGGSLIHNSWVLTSAYCAKGATSFKIYLGTLIINAGTLATSNTAFVHPLFTTPPAYDIALIKLSAPVGLPVFGIDIVPLISRRMCCDPELYRDVLTGWGKLSTAATTPSTKLQQIFVTDITNGACMMSWGPSVVIPTVMCTTSNASYMPYTFDQGDPLVRTPYNNYKYIQVGIVTMFRQGLPTVYTKICHFHDWIQLKTGINFGS